MKVLYGPRRREKRWQKKVHCRGCGARLLATAKDIRMRLFILPGTSKTYDEEVYRENRACVCCPLCKKYIELKGCKLPGYFFPQAKGDEP